MSVCALCSDKEFKCDWNIDRDLGLFNPNSNFGISDKKIIINTYAGNDYMGFIELDIEYCPVCGKKLASEVAE